MWPFNRKKKILVEVLDKATQRNKDCSDTLIKLLEQAAEGAGKEILRK